jgi:hypothetical protein
MNELETLLRRHLASPESGWSMGSFGAIAEFHQDDGEVAVIDMPQALTRATRRGAISLDRTALSDAAPVAYETLSPKRHRWSQALALCLPEQAARSAARSVLTELGPEDHAIRGIDRTGILFDMGLSLPQCDFCIRTSDPKLLAELRSNLGRSLFEHDNGAMLAILAAHPHRVALTRLGRVEVYQKIGGPDTGGVSPPGPHTHVLPKLLRSGRTHSANTPIPEGLLPLAYLHPGNPVINPMGKDRPFAPHLHEEFQALLLRYGLADCNEAKQKTYSAIAGQQLPADFAMPEGRHARASVRLALRQLEHRARHASDLATLTTLQGWLLLHEGDLEDADDDAPGH